MGTTYLSSQPRFKNPKVRSNFLLRRFRYVFRVFHCTRFRVFIGRIPVVPALLAPQRHQHELRQPHLQENDRGPVHVGEESAVSAGQGVSHVRRRGGKLQRYHLREKYDHLHTHTHIHTQSLMPAHGRRKIINRQFSALKFSFCFDYFFTRCVLVFSRQLGKCASSRGNIVFIIFNNIYCVLSMRKTCNF